MCAQVTGMMRAVRPPFGIASHSTCRAMFALGASAVALLAVIEVPFHAGHADLHEPKFSSPPVHTIMLAMLLAAATVISMMPKSSLPSRMAFCCMIIAGITMPADAANAAGRVNPVAWQRAQAAAEHSGRTRSLGHLFQRNLELRGGEMKLLHEHSFQMRPGAIFKTSYSPMPAYVLSFRPYRPGWEKGGM